MIFSRLFNQKRPSSRGDTIVEVLISVAILALVLATAYVAASNSLRTGTSAGQRNQALGYAQSQIEYIKGMQAGSQQQNGTLSDITDGNGDFCFTSTGALIDEIDKTNPGWPEPIRQECLSYDDQTYSVRATYTPELKVFTIRVSWSCASTSAEDCSLKLYYKLPGNTSGGGGGDEICGNGIDDDGDGLIDENCGGNNPPTVDLTASPPAVQVNHSSNLTWESTNATGCTASASPSNPNWVGSITPVASGSRSTGLLTSIGLKTFTLQCDGPGGSDTDTATVNVTSDPPPPGGGGCISTGGIGAKPGNTQANPCIYLFDHVGGGNFDWYMDHCYVSGSMDPGGSVGWVDDDKEAGTTSSGVTNGEVTLYCMGGDAGSTWLTRPLGGGPPPDPEEGSLCFNGIDDDQDGLVDSADPGCQGPPPTETQTGCLWSDGSWAGGYPQANCNIIEDPNNQQPMWGTACIELPSTFLAWSPCP